VYLEKVVTDLSATAAVFQAADVDGERPVTELKCCTCRVRACHVECSGAAASRALCTRTRMFTHYVLAVHTTLQ